MTYRERSLGPGMVLWSQDAGASPGTRLIVPDGCLDLLWDGRELLVVGPDRVAREHRSPPDARYTALRFSGGLGPALVGVPADELRDRTVPARDLMPAREGRRLAELAAVDPEKALQAWVFTRAAERPVDPLGPAVLAMATAGVPVAGMADRLGMSPRQLHRRCLSLFGYGPRRLARVTRLGRVLPGIRAGLPLAQLAASCGYADQAHLSRDVRELTGVTPSRLLAALPG